MGIKEKLGDMLGDIPQNGPVELVSLGTEWVGDIERRVVEYGGSGGQRLRAFLLLPPGAGPFPAALALHPHQNRYNLGKSEVAGYLGDPGMAYGLELARRGIAVICPDFLCFESRRSGVFTLPENDGSNEDEKNRASYLLAQGSSYGAVCLADMLAALAALQSLPQVDGGRIAAMGHNLGGQEAVFLGLLRDEIRAVVCSCGLSTLRHRAQVYADVNTAAVLPGLQSAGDYDTLLAELAPKPLFFTYPAKDGAFPPEGQAAIEKKAVAAWHAAGAADALIITRISGTSGFPEAVQKQACAWLAARLGA